MVPIDPQYQTPEMDHRALVRELHRIVVALHSEVRDGTLTAHSAAEALASLLPLDAEQLDDETAATMRSDLERWRLAQASPPDLADIRARLGAATPGPWRVDYPDDDRFPCAVELVDKRTEHTRVWVADNVARADAELIAHAPADLRRLLDEVARLRALLGEGA